MRLWAAWLQGREAAPESVRAILSLWERLNPDDDLTVLDQADADAILARLGVRQPRISPQVVSNHVRLAVLREHGGTWVDATLLPSTPLASWLPPLRAPAGFFAFTSSGDPNLVLQNWFLSAEPGSLLVERLAEAYAAYFSVTRRYPTWKRAVYHGRVGDYLRYRRRWEARDTSWFVDPEGGLSNPFYPYAVYNYVLARLLRTDAVARAAWERVPFRTHRLPMGIAALASDPETDEATFLRHAADMLDAAPVHKLNHRDPRFARLAAIAAERSGV